MTTTQTNSPIQNTIKSDPKKIEKEDKNVPNLAKYKPHEKQELFHGKVHKSRWVFGGNRTGKTECGAVEAVRIALGQHKHYSKTPTEGWIISISLQVQRDVAQRKILHYLTENDIEAVVMKSGSRASGSRARGIIDFIQLKNGSKIGFKSIDQGREKFQGTGLDWVWFDEEPPENIYEEALLRTLDKGGIVWGTMTPLKGKTWLHDRIFLDQDNHEIIQMSWVDNTSLSKEEVAKMKRNLSADALESREHGRFQEGGGVIFKELGDANIIEPKVLSGNFRTILAIDPAYTSLTGAVWVKTDGEVFYVVGDYAVAGITVEEHAKNLRELYPKFGVPDEVLIDSSAVQKNLASGDTTVVNQFAKHGIPVNPSVCKGVTEGIHKVKILLRDCHGVRRLFIFKTCKTLLREMRGYTWGAGEAPIKKDDHCLDALRYIIMTPSKTSPTVTHKQQVINEKRRNIL
ncbi:MAG: terminase family protein [Firmicutes bacterium]|nr:terminase family protein [Bacillota bacterium]